MLKIKDNIDLKELEKYGFTHNGLEGYYEMYIKTYDEGPYKIWITIVASDGCYHTRHIYIQNNYYDCDYDVIVPDVIYDLIKAGLVEKVED